MNTQVIAILIVLFDVREVSPDGKDGEKCDEYINGCITHSSL